jgi:hypothetical protein
MAIFIKFHTLDGEVDIVQTEKQIGKIIILDFIERRTVF